MENNRIVQAPEKKMVGNRLSMSFASNKTGELWRSFMPRRREICHALGTELYDIQIYGEDFDFENFDPNKPFEKWAAVEVTDFDDQPASMECLTLPSGLYAVFVHRGDASTGPETYRYILQTWLPKSGYILDKRPHFNVLGEKYKNDDPNSEEEIWIPIR